MEITVSKRKDEYVIPNRLLIAFLSYLILFPFYQNLLCDQDLHSLKLKRFPRHQVSLRQMVFSPLETTISRYVLNCFKMSGMGHSMLSSFLSFRTFLVSSLILSTQCPHKWFSSLWFPQIAHTSMSVLFLSCLWRFLIFFLCGVVFFLGTAINRKPSCFVFNSKFPSDSIEGDTFPNKAASWKFLPP